MRKTFCGVAVAVLLSLPVMGQAATIGAWTFDTAGAVDGSYATALGSILDSSAQGNHLTQHRTKAPSPRGRRLRRARGRSG